jgi:uncharacterized protein YlaI
MKYDYRGPEILTELVINVGCKGAGKIKQHQDIDVKCSVCSGIKRVDYRGHAFCQLKYPDRVYKCITCIKSDRMAQYNRAQLGKTLIERLGPEKAAATKEKIGKHSISTKSLKGLVKFYGMTWEEKFGKERADLMKIAASKNCILRGKFGADNPQFGKPAHKLSGRGCKGHYRGTFFRSILEASYMHYMHLNNIKFENGELKKYAIPYVLNGRPRNYFCDFIIDGHYYEIKPKALLTTEQNRAKFEAATIWCAERGVTYNVRSEEDFHRLTTLEVDSLKNDGILTLL